MINSAELRIPKTHKLFIAGEFPRSESGRSSAWLKADGSVYANLALASRKDARAGVEAARAAQPGWAGRSAILRGQIIYRWAEMLESRRAEFIEISALALDQDPRESLREFQSMIDSLVYYAGFTDKYAQVWGSVNPVAGPYHHFTTLEPVGVVASIAACTRMRTLSDLADTIDAWAAIVASGNSLVAVLPLEMGPFLTILAETAATSDFPKGVINILSGSPTELAPWLASHMEIQSLCLVGCAFPEDLASSLRLEAVNNLKRLPLNLSRARSLERILDFVEAKSVWHPIGS